MKGHIKFKKSSKEGVINEIEVWNLKDEFLGFITYYPKWKKWVFEPDGSTFYDTQCLLKIIEKMKTLPKLKELDNR